MDSLPGLPREHSPADIWFGPSDTGFGFLASRTVGEYISVCSFKPPGLWWFVITTTGDSCRCHYYLILRRWKLRLREMD